MNPSAASRSQMAEPIPPAAPVTTATPPGRHTVSAAERLIWIAAQNER